MLDATIFTTNFHVQPLEIIGVGMHRFDVYVLRGVNICKYTVLGQDYKEAIQAFCYRFQLKYGGRKKFTNRGIVAYRLRVRAIATGMKACDDCVIKMMV